MVQILKSLLALASLLIMSIVAARANSAPLPAPEEQWQPAAATNAEAAACRRPLHRRRLVPGPQAGTHLQAQPFAYGYFGRTPPRSAVFHTSSRGNWYQWSFYRAD